METTIRIESIRVEGRFRKDLGDLDELAKSIAKVGLLHAVVVTKDNRLVAGERRIEAARRLGWQVIDARVVDNLTDAVALLEAERDENECRKQKTVSELVALAAALEELEAERIALRKHEDAVRAGRIRQGTEPPRGSEEPRAERARDIAGRAVGLPPTSYFKAKTVVEAAKDESLPEEDKAIAEQALAEMDETGSIAPAYEKVKGIRDASLGAPQKSTIGSASKQRKVIDAAVVKLSGLSHGLRQIEVVHPEITSEEAAQWVGDLSDARLVIERLIKRLKERSSAQA